MPSYHKSPADGAGGTSSVSVTTTETLSVIVPSGRFSISSIHVWGDMHSTVLERSDWIAFLNHDANGVST
jgi:hypothetical protein